uniref:Cell division control protein n=1 Tax=Sinocyclocheilus grahami TaxID=75366 RepID=A0A672PGX8_SINGR
MPSTRSQNQPTLQFPRRKSSRLGSRPKSSSENAVDVQTTPLSPRKSNVGDPPGVCLSPRNSVLKNTSLSERLPLSPRKRTGDENGCNLPASMLGSPPKQRCAPLGSPRKLAFNENTPVFSSPKIPLSPISRPRLQETPCSNPIPYVLKPVSRITQLLTFNKQSVSVVVFSSAELGYQSVKQALHTAERAAIVSFLENHVMAEKPSSLYISGAPGTGKAACLNCVLQEQKALLKGVQTVVINCMNLRSSHAIFPLLGEKLGAPKGNSEARLEKLLTSSGSTVLLVLDEMDQLDSKSQEVLYTIFEWPYLANSRVCLIGIANALDLTDRILPRLQAKPHCRPKLLNFPPYSREELNAIVQDRLTQVTEEGVLDAAAVQFCARKVSAVSGDARKALDICRRAVEIVEATDRSKMASEPAASPKVWWVSVPQVAWVLSEVYGDRMASSSRDGESFPLQQKLLVCCLLLIIRNGRSKEVQLGKLCEVYSKLCKQRQVGGVGQTECLSLCSLLESRAIFTLKKAKEARLTKISLKIEERDVENALKDRTLLGSILAAGLP